MAHNQSSKCDCVDSLALSAQRRRYVFGPPQRLLFIFLWNRPKQIACMALAVVSTIVVWRPIISAQSVCRARVTFVGGRSCCRAGRCAPCALLVMALYWSAGVRAFVTCPFRHIHRAVTSRECRATLERTLIIFIESHNKTPAGVL